MIYATDEYNEGIKNLVIAVILRACEDYLIGLINGKQDPHIYGINEELTKKDLIAWNMQDAYKFLTSETFATYTKLDSKTIIRRLHLRAKETKDSSTSRIYL